MVVIIKRGSLINRVVVRRAHGKHSHEKYNDLHGDSPPEFKGTLFKLEIHRRIGILRVYKSVQKGKKNSH